MLGLVRKKAYPLSLFVHLGLTYISPLKHIRSSGVTTANYTVSSLTNNNDRLRRANSWLALSEDSDSDDEAFIFLWIAFNAAYGTQFTDPTHDGNAPSEFSKFKDFLMEILKRDSRSTISAILSGKSLAGRVNHLLHNQYVFEPFWRSLRAETKEDGASWRDQFERRNAAVAENFRKLNETRRSEVEVTCLQEALVEVFLRLYTLRNQVFHGGATYATGRGRKQVRDGSFIMATLVPVILSIMEDDIKENPSTEVWGEVAYTSITSSSEVNG